MSNSRMAAPNVVSIRSDSDIVAARMAARDVARRLGFSAIDQARIATTTSELVRNIIAYAGAGSLTIATIQRDQKNGIELIFEDTGPGIASLSQNQANGLAPPAGTLDGIGLAGARRLMDEMTIETSPDSGTRVVCRKWRR